MDQQEATKGELVLTEKERYEAAHGQFGLQVMESIRVLHEKDIGSCYWSDYPLSKAVAEELGVEAAIVLPDGEPDDEVHWSRSLVERALSWFKAAQAAHRFDEDEDDKELVGIFVETLQREHEKTDEQRKADHERGLGLCWGDLPRRHCRMVADVL